VSPSAPFLRIALVLQLAGATQAHADGEDPEPPPAGFDAQGAPLPAAPAPAGGRDVTAPAEAPTTTPPSPAAPAAPAPAQPVPLPATPAPAPAAPADASGNELDLFRLDAVLNDTVVTASGGEEEERSTALANVFTISRDDIRARGYRSVADVLADVPGLYVIDDLVTPSISVRGVNGGLAAGTRIVKVMINGQVVGFRPELTAFLGPEFLPIGTVERIEVAKGPLSSLYGANAFLATVNVITRRGAEGLSAEAGAHLSLVNANPGGGGSLQLSYRGDKAWLLAAVAGERINRSGVSLPNSFDGQAAVVSPTLFGRPTQADLATPVSMYFSTGVGSDKIGNLVAQLGLQHQDAINNFRLNSLLTDTSRVVINNFYSSLHYDKEWRRGGLALDAAYAYGSPDRDYLLQLTNNPSYSFHPNYDYQSGRVHAEGSYDPLGEKLQLRIGGDFEYARETSLYYTQIFNTHEGARSPGDRVDLIGDSQARQQDYYGVGAYLRISSRPIRRVSGLRLSVDLRVDKIWFGPIEFDPQISARAGLSYKLSPRFALKVFGGRAFQTPSGTLLFGYPGFGSENNVIGNVNLTGGTPLKPQTADTLEAGLTATPSKHLAIEASVYLQDIGNEIEFTQVGPDFFAINGGRQDFVGGEAVARSSYGRFTAYLWGAFNWAVGKEPMNPPSLYPNLTGALGVDVDIPEAYLHVHARVKGVGPRGPSQSNVYVNNNQTYELPAYYTADLSLSSKALHVFAATAETRLMATARNLTAVHWIDPGFGGYDQPNVGQSFWFECKQSF
jgi:iron complex outermembrane receptor protein